MLNILNWWGYSRCYRFTSMSPQVCLLHVTSNILPFALKVALLITAIWSLLLLFLVGFCKIIIFQFFLACSLNSLSLSLRHESLQAWAESKMELTLCHISETLTFSSWSNLISLTLSFSRTYSSSGNTSISV